MGLYHTDRHRRRQARHRRLLQGSRALRTRRQNRKVGGKAAQRVWQPAEVWLLLCRLHGSRQMGSPAQLQQAHWDSQTWLLAAT